MQTYRVLSRSLLFVLLLPGPMCARSQDVCTLTLLKDTPLRVIRGITVFEGVEGMRIRQGDFLQTGPAPTAQAQLEFGGGAVIELGPSSQAYVFSVTGGAADVVLAAGWLKGESTSGAYRYDSPLLSATAKGGNVLLHVSDDAADLFVERGAAAVSAGAGSPINSSSDKSFFTRRPGKPITSADRPSSGFISAMPVSFRDALPPRIARFTGNKPPEPKAEREVSFPDIERLLKLPAAWRKGLVDRFAPRLHDSSFRQAIEARIGALPDWKPVLNSDKQ